MTQEELITKVAGLKKDPDFMAKVRNTNSDEELDALLEQYGITKEDASGGTIVFTEDEPGELTEDSLESVAGGSTWGDIVIKMTRCPRCGFPLGRYFSHSCRGRRW